MMSNPLTDKFNVYVINRYLRSEGETTMARKGRPASQQPATAYDYRHVIALVHALALEESGLALGALADAWGIEWTFDHEDSMTIVKKLAQHALASAREEGADDGS